MNPVFSSLEPKEVWQHFAMLCETPRASGAEQQVVEKITDWARSRGFEATSDAYQNLILSVPASKGRENAPGVILQAHLDMVCQKESGHTHDFSHDAIQPAIEAGWLVARRTTLGADNGIGVALALAALEADIPHGPLEVLLTSSEEEGMKGAHALAVDTLKGEYLLNLDSEEWGLFYLGCAGAVRVDATFPASVLPPSPTTPQHVALELKLDGLLGGHSGLDIHLPRCNAIRCLGDALLELSMIEPFALAEFTGGTVSNAIPRAASAILVLPPDRHERGRMALADAIPSLRGHFAREYPPERHLAFTLELVPTPAEMIVEEKWTHFLRGLLRLPYGVIAMHPDLPNVVATSNNFAPCHLRPGEGSCSLLVRSVSDAERNRLSKEIWQSIVLMGGKASFQGLYPGWQADPESLLWTQAETLYKQTFFRTPSRSIIHTGLECSLFGKKKPDLQMLSFGPDIKGAHAPGEKVRVASVVACWQFLTRLITRLSD